MNLKPPYDGRLTEALAALVLRVVMDAQSISWKDTGKVRQIHDFDLLLATDVVHVEVTSAMSEVELSTLAAIQRRKGSLATASADWFLILTLDSTARIAVVLKELPQLLGAISSAGVAEFDTLQMPPGLSEVARRLAEIGIPQAQGARTAPGQGTIVVRQPSVIYGQGESLTDSVERIANLPDNVKKLRQAGGGHLFIWVDASHPAHLGFWNPAGLTSERKPMLPQGVETVWAGQLFAATAADGSVRAYCGALWRAISSSNWEQLTDCVPQAVLAMGAQDIDGAEPSAAGGIE